MSDFTNPRISERKFYRIDPILLAVNGTTNGLVTVSSTYCFKVGQKVTLRSDVFQPRNYKVKAITSETELLIGTADTSISIYSDISDFIVADNAVIVVPEQKRPSIDPLDIQGMVFEEEPTVALRTHSVDWLGRSYDIANPLPARLNDIDVSASNELQTRDNDANASLTSLDDKIVKNVIDSNNSTTIPLGADVSFVGVGTDVSRYTSVSILLHSDQDSALDGMNFQFSTDNVNWDENNPFNLDASESPTRRFQFPILAKYFRINYTNNSTAQTEFRVQTILHTSDILTSIHRIDKTLGLDRSVTVVKSVISGETTAGGGEFVNVKVNPSGSLQATVDQDTHDSLNANANIQVNDIDVSASNPVNVVSDSLKPIVTKPVDGSEDSFGRLRVSTIKNIFESTHVNSDQSEFWDSLTVGGSSTVVHNPQTASVDLTVGTVSGDRALRRTLEYFHYASGQSMLVRFTGVMGAGEQNCQVDLGYYNDDNGIIFRNKDGVAQLVIRSDVSGSVVETAITQPNWNLDTVDGSSDANNPSGIQVDPTKTHIFQIEYQWLGVGIVKMGIHIGGRIIYLHEFLHANVEADVYMRTPHLPVSYEIKNTGTTTGSNTLKQLCTQVANEGRAIVGDLIRSVDMGSTFTTVNTSSDTPLISHRIAPGNEGVSIEFVNFDFWVSTNDDVLFKIFVDGVLTAPSWVVGTDEGGFTEKDVSATAISGGRKMGSTWINKGGKTMPGQFKSKFRLGFKINGTPDHITVTGRSRSGTADCSVAILYVELF